eukprot:TRINITY_DN22021_c0_g1_i1.p1 TRINITY_DN22021_c0_g1~~TRINITY_DN22021_c0_g1_i1.p1  ORF type:complete len:330 (+),score=73.86 TRINITY_DN22021_c0_g1_i1:147-1136(+)
MGGRDGFLHSVMTPAAPSPLRALWEAPKEPAAPPPPPRHAGGVWKRAEHRGSSAAAPGAAASAPGRMGSADPTRRRDWAKVALQMTEAVGPPSPPVLLIERTPPPSAAHMQLVPFPPTATPPTAPGTPGAHGPQQGTPKPRAFTGMTPMAWGDGRPQSARSDGFSLGVHRRRYPATARPPLARPSGSAVSRRHRGAVLAHQRRALDGHLLHMSLTDPERTSMDVASAQCQRPAQGGSALAELYKHAAVVAAAAATPDDQEDLLLLTGAAAAAPADGAVVVAADGSVELPLPRAYVPALPSAAEMSLSRAARAHHTRAEGAPLRLPGMLP